ncbi:MAG TPA: hypothetical protein VK929_09075 [Longimicrobiales bacterium]|nr:hypothetical protein [Longimicrobiales bacterium]
MSRRSTRSRSRVPDQKLQMAAAIAREAVLQLHVEHALAMVRHAAGRVGEVRMLEIYMRLLELSGIVAESVGNRVLASLGHAQAGGGTARIVSSLTPSAPADEAGADDVASGDDGASAADVAPPTSLFSLLRRRLRGRVHADLRRDVEVQVGVAKTALLHTHVAHAHRFVRLLEDSHSVADACAYYTDLVEVPPSHAAVLYMLVLDRIGAETATTATPPSSRPADLHARRLRRHAL